MSCCAKVETRRRPSGSGTPPYVPPSEISPGETLECYSKRSGDPTGLQDDAPEQPTCTIENTSIAVSPTRQTANTFRLAKTTPPCDRTPTQWKMFYENIEVTSLDGVPFTPGGTFNGTFNPNAAGNSYTVRVEAHDGAGLIDSKTYSFGIPKNGECTFKLINPMPQGRITSQYGPRVHPVHGTPKLHGGIDISTPGSAISPILAAADGVVTFVGVNGSLSSGYGKTIKIEHKDCAGKVVCETLYGHLEEFYVQVGDTVRAGQRIGLEGNTGTSTAAHLHFEVRTPGGGKTDPVPWFQGEVVTARQAVPPKTEPAGDNREVKQSDAAISQTDMTARDC